MTSIEATQQAEEIALLFAGKQGIEGRLLGVKPDAVEAKRRGKTPLLWVAAFEAVQRGVAFDGLILLRIDLETRTAEPFNGGESFSADS